ncbi:hypothetical protein HFO16_35085 [Rhizobium laguerreae]|uniref:hypothetical protein n=1 Tax=Rhizobium laguerreae TaxID=1076926 RepID=UPI001C9052C9|nr:hypothetical protein [Rhizobium laguerreae]MBY3246511.1 hypothetical protein [Rhizobium laguerreae]
MAKLGQEVEQPLGRLGLLFQDVRPEAEQEPESRKRVAQVKILGVAVGFLDAVRRVLSIGGIHPLRRYQQFRAGHPVGDDDINLLQVILSQDRRRRRRNGGDRCPRDQMGFRLGSNGYGK